MSRFTERIECYGQFIGVMNSRLPFVCLDFDGTLSEIVSDPDMATLVDGAAEALEASPRNARSQYCPAGTWQTSATA